MLKLAFADLRFWLSKLQHYFLLLQEELLELQDANLASTIREQQKRTLEFWEKNWVKSCLFCNDISRPFSFLFCIIENLIAICHNVLCLCLCILNLNQHNGVPLKIKRLARDPERFIWAVSIAQSRCINMQMRIGALVQDANMLIPYAGMLLSI